MKKVIGPACPFCGLPTEAERYKETVLACDEEGIGSHYEDRVDAQRWRWSCACGFASPVGYSTDPGSALSQATRAIEQMLSKEAS